jgi:hypothetical protein
LVTIAIKIAGKLGMDLADTNNLCSQLLKYRNAELPFDQPFLKSDDIIKWWTSLEIDPPILQTFALWLFSIYPNSASCERDFSTCGWISSKRRLKLGVERLESMVKLISYYRSNPSNELAFYGKGTKHSPKLNYSELITIVNETLAEGDDDDNEVDNVQRLTTDGHIIPNHKVRIFIEDTINLSDKIIIHELGELLDNDLEKDDDENEEENLKEIFGKGVMDFNVEKLVNEFGSK